MTAIFTIPLPVDPVGESAVVAGAWTPPNGFDPVDVRSLSLWRWILSQTWLVRLEEWETIADCPTLVRSDLLCAGERFLSQLARLWKLEWHWDGLYPPRVLTRDNWDQWYGAFAAWIRPWFRQQDWSRIDCVRIETPSDVLWFGLLLNQQPVCASCVHGAAADFVAEVYPHARIRTDEAGAGFASPIPDRGMEWSSAHSAPLTQAEWRAKITVPDRRLYEDLGYPKPWRCLTDDDRDQIRATGHWRRSPAGRNCDREAGGVVPFQPTPARAAAERVNLAEEPYATAIYERIAALRVSDVPLFPGPKDWTDIHHHLLQGIYPFAGKCRCSDLAVTAGRSGTVQAAYVCFEAEVLRQQWSTAWPSATTPEQKLAALAWSHLRFQRLHPFYDGNGHVGRIWIARQAVEFGQPFEPLRWEKMRSEYRNAMTRSMVEKDPTHLQDWLRKVLSISALMGDFPYRSTPLLLMAVRLCKS